MQETNTSDKIKKIILLNIVFLALLIISLNSTIIQTTYIEEGEESDIKLKFKIESIESSYDLTVNEIDYGLVCSSSGQSSMEDTSMFCDLEKAGNILKIALYSTILISSFSLFYLFTLFLKLDFFSEKTIYYIDKYTFSIPLIILILGNLIWITLVPTSSQISTYWALDTGEPFSNYSTIFTFGFYLNYLIILVNICLFIININWPISKYWNQRNKNPGKTEKEIHETPFNNLQVKLEKIDTLLSEGIITESERDKLRESEMSKII